MKYTLTVLDTIGIQKYIFASNRLRENIGASELVERSIKQWAYESLPHPNNVPDPSTGELDRTGELDPNLQIERDGLAAEVIYAGGGNTAILFSAEKEAKRFVRDLSVKVLTRAPGLQVAAVRLSIDYSKEPLAKKVKKALEEKLGDAKRNRPINIPGLGLSVTAECQSTGLPATGIDPWPMEGEPARLVSSEVAAKVLAAPKANERLQRDLIPPDLKDKYDIPYDFDNLARIRGESSYLAVVHADGNNMGQRVKNLADRFQEPEQNRAYINAMREFSESIEEASKAALKTCIRFVDQHVEKDPDNPNRYILADSLVLEEGEDGRPYLPFRPLVFGGDDVTFVCNGQIGLALAAKYLETFEQQQLSDGASVYSCAGVAVVKLHYPFSRAYALSEELCQNAKKWVRKWTNEHDSSLSALDWHFSTTGLAGDLEFIRKREYTVRDGSLYLRPLRLHNDAGDPRSWPVVKELLGQFGDTKWSQRRNKVKRLREALREGPEEVKKFVEAYGELPGCAAAGFPASARKSGWVDGVCVYFDAIEAMDYALLLDKL
jgi:hypothetical protein